MTDGEATEFVRARLAKLDARLCDAQQRLSVAERGDTPAGDARADEALHDLRVAVRTIRVVLRLARPLFGRRNADSVRAPFTELGALTSPLRDEEVFEATIAAVAFADPHLDAYRAQRREREQQLRRALLETLRTGRIERARNMLELLLRMPQPLRRQQPLWPFAEGAVAGALARVAKLVPPPSTDVAVLHALRIAYKQLRYTVELFSGVLSEERMAIAKAAKQQQAVLGDIHDLDVACAALTAATSATPTAPLPAAVVLRLVGQLQARRALLLPELYAEREAVERAAQRSSDGS